MNLILDDQAATDFRELTAGYLAVRQELAEKFSNAVYKRFDEIVQFPEALPRISKKFRKATVAGFP